MKVRHYISVLLLLLAPRFAVAGEYTYGAEPLDSSWTVDSSRLRCALSHDIPHYGIARFEKLAGQELRFVIEVGREALHSDVARLASVPPEWMHAGLRRDLGQVAVARGNTPFSFERALSYRVLTELEKGMYPTIRYRDWADARDEVAVWLSAVNFRQSLDQFGECLRKLVPYQFAEVREAQIFFGFGSSRLGNADQEKLNRMIEYVLADPSVKEVRIDGFSDHVGPRRDNLVQSEMRAMVVQDYLVANGIPESMIKLTARGEERARTLTARARARRAEVTLVK